MRDLRGLTKLSKYKSKDVSVIVCTRNAEGDIEACLNSIIANAPGEILVVDGRSTDKTCSIVGRMGLTWISDEGRGLAYARRVGVANTRLPLIMFVGPDNILPNRFLEEFIVLREMWNFDVASVSTRIQNPVNFWDRGMDFRWKCNMGKPGLVDVPGTPNLYARDIFDKANFSERDFGGADDTDLCEQLKIFNFKLGIVPLSIFEKSGWSAKSIWNRFKFYGSGDSCFYDHYKCSWSLKRKFQSITHPFRQTICYSKRAIYEGKLLEVAWLFYVMVARYYGWASYKRGEIKNYSSY